MVKEKYLKFQPRVKQSQPLMDIFHKVELATWNFIIHIMSDSETIRSVIQESYVLIEERTRMRYILIIFAWACAGLAIGFILGFLRVLIG